MPGPVSDSYDPEFGTADNAVIIRDAFIEVRNKISKTLPEQLKHIVSVVKDGSDLRIVKIGFTERERRILRFALNREIESI